MNQSSSPHKSKVIATTTTTDLVDQSFCKRKMVSRDIYLQDRGFSRIAYGGKFARQRCTFRKPVSVSTLFSQLQSCEIFLSKFNILASYFRLVCSTQLFFFTHKVQ
jgi:hypothetical protein